MCACVRAGCCVRGSSVRLLRCVFDTPVRIPRLYRVLVKCTCVCVCVWVFPVLLIVSEDMFYFIYFYLFACIIRSVRNSVKTRIVKRKKINMHNTSIDKRLPLSPQRYSKDTETPRWVFKKCLIVIYEKYSQSSTRTLRNTPKNTTILHWRLWKVVVLREQSVSEYWP